MSDIRRTFTKRYSLRSFIITVFLSINLMPIYAIDLGTFGKTYPILEEDFLKFIEHRIVTLKQTGEWQKLQKGMQEKVKAEADRPPLLKPLTPAKIKKTHTFDPTITLSEDLKDHEGRIFAEKGKNFNPLTLVKLNNALLFFDGDNEKEILWAKQKNNEFKSHTKLILVNGSISQTEKIFHQRIYFDQGGNLTKHFQIEHTPALVTQDGLQLTILEDLA